MTSASADFDLRQERYLLWRRLIRDVLLRTLAFPILGKVSVSGAEVVPPSGPTLLYINHISGIDPIVVAGAVTPRFVIPMSKVENFALPVFGAMLRRWGAYPVRRGQPDKSAIQHTLDLLRAGQIVLIAPEGTRQPALIRAKHGLAFAATQTDAVLVPVGVDGTRDFTRNLRRLRKTPITLRFGRPFRFTRNGTVGRAELAHMTNEAMYRLAALLPEHRRGYYADLSQATTESIAEVG